METTGWISRVRIGAYRGSHDPSRRAIVYFYFFLLVIFLFLIHNKRVNGYERKILINNILKSEGRIQINELAERLEVTKVTVRSDLDDLEKRGLLVRTHGGAILAENQQLVRLISKTISEREQEKAAIAQLAAEIIEPGSTILIDSGSTTHFLAREIRDMRLTVITNSILVIRDLSGSDSIELLVSGGALRKESMALIGQISRSFFEQFHADIVFLGATSLSVEKGVSCSNIIEAETKRNMIKCGVKVCLLADSTKSGKISMAHICDWGDIDVLITDSMSAEDDTAFEQHGVKVIKP